MSLLEITYLLINSYQKDPMSPLSTFVAIAPESFFFSFEPYVVETPDFLKMKS